MTLKERLRRRLRSWLEEPDLDVVPCPRCSFSYAPPHHPGPGGMPHRRQAVSLIALGSHWEKQHGTKDELRQALGR